MTKNKKKALEREKQVLQGHLLINEPEMHITDAGDFVFFDNLNTKQAKKKIKTKISEIDEKLKQN